MRFLIHVGPQDPRRATSGTVPTLLVELKAGREFVGVARGAVRKPVADGAAEEPMWQRLRLPLATVWIRSGSRSLSPGYPWWDARSGRKASNFRISKGSTGSAKNCNLIFPSAEASNIRIWEVIFTSNVEKSL